MYIKINMNTPKLIGTVGIVIILVTKMTTRKSLYKSLLQHRYDHVIFSATDATSDIVASNKRILKGMIVQEFSELKSNVINVLEKDLFRNRLDTMTPTVLTQPCKWFLETNTKDRFEIDVGTEWAFWFVHGAIVQIEGVFSQNLFHIHSWFFPILPELLTIVTETIDIRFGDNNTLLVNNYTLPYMSSEQPNSLVPISSNNPLYLFDNQVAIVYGARYQRRCIEVNPSLENCIHVITQSLLYWRHLCPLSPSFGLVPREYDFENKQVILLDHDELCLPDATRVLIVVEHDLNNQSVHRVLYNDRNQEFDALYVTKSVRICFAKNRVIKIETLL